MYHGLSLQEFHFHLCKLVRDPGSITRTHPRLLWLCNMKTSASVGFAVRRRGNSSPVMVPQQPEMNSNLMASPDASCHQWSYSQMFGEFIWCIH